LAVAVLEELLAQTEALTESIQYFLQLHRRAAAQVLINLDQPMMAAQAVDLVMLELQQEQVTHHQHHHHKVAMVD